MITLDTRRRIDAARDVLVGKIPDPKAQVEQITTALIYKFMDDMDEESEELGGKARFFINEYEKYAWSKLLDPRLGGYERLNLYVEALSKMPQNPNLPQLFRNILKDAFLPYRDPETLNLFLKEINGFVYEHNSDKLGDAFEYLLSVLGSQGDAGQFRTPRHIIDFIVGVVDPKKDETILDPACGTAGFLISGYKHILRQNTTNRRGDQLTPDERTRLMSHFIGYDISPDMMRLSLVNMYLHGFPNPNVFEYDTLTNEERWGDLYDDIMANPPFMTPKGGIRPHKRFSIQANRSEVLFVDYIAEHLTTHGRAGVIVPEGIIFQSGNAYKALRKMLVEKYLFAVVSLPAGVFQPYSGVKTCILFMDKQLAKKTDSILFVKVENDGFDLGAQRRAIEKNDLTEALYILQKYKQALNENTNVQDMFIDEEETTLATVVEKAKIAKNGDYNLSGERYRESIVRLHQEWPMVELGEVFEKVNQTIDPKHTNGIVNYIGLENIASNSGQLVGTSSIDVSNIKSLKSQFQTDDILYGKLRPNLNKVWLASFNGICSTDILVLRPLRTKAISQLYQFLLRSNEFNQEVLKGLKGAQLPRVSYDYISKLKIPHPPLEVQQEIVAELASYQKIIDGARQVVENYKPSVKIDPNWATLELGEICEFRNGINYTKDSSGERIKILGVKAFQDNFYLDINDLSSIVADGEVKESDLLNENDIVFVRSNGNQKLIGRCLLVGKVEERITHSGFTIRLVLKYKELNPVFLTHILKLDVFRQRMIEGGTGANIKSLTQGILENLTIPIPSFEIQQQIVAQIEEEQKRVQATNELIEIFEQKIKDKIAEVWGE